MPEWGPAAVVPQWVPGPALDRRILERVRTSLRAPASWFRLGALRHTDARQHLAQDAIKRPPPPSPSMGYGAGKRADCAAVCPRTGELVGRGVARVSGAAAAAAAAAAALVRRRIRQRRQRLLGRRCAAQHRLFKLARPGSWSYHSVVAKCTASGAAWAVLTKDCKLGKRERTGGPNADRLWLQPVSLTTRAVPQHAGAPHAHKMAGTARARQGRAARGGGAPARCARHSFSSSASGSEGGARPDVARADRMTLPGNVCCARTGIGRPADTCGRAPPLTPAGRPAQPPHAMTRARRSPRRPQHNRHRRRLARLGRGVLPPPQRPAGLARARTQAQA